MPDHDCTMVDEIRAQSRRHHDALTRITEVTSAIQTTQNTILGHLVGTFDKPGLAHRVAALESRGRVDWWKERGTKLVDLLLGAAFVGVLVWFLQLGFRSAVRDIIIETQREVSMAVDMARKAPRDPACPGCAPTVAAAE